MTVNDLARVNPIKLADRTGMGSDTAEKAVKQAIQLVERGYITGRQLYEEIKDRRYLTTGSKTLDKLLGGGIESGTTVELAGPNGSGKTQVCHMLAVTVQLPYEQGGLEGQVVWIDTEDTFRPDRILEICEARGLSYEKILDGILVAKAFNSNHQQILIEELSKVCQEHPIKLIIVDSMMAHLRGEYIGRATLSRRQNVLSDMLQEIGKIVQTHGIAAIYTNQVLSDPGVMFGNPEKAIGGNVMGHAATTRVHLRKGRELVRVAKLVKSPYLPEGEAPFVIDEYGVRDTEKYREEEDEE